jgi:MFS family permease
MLMAIPSGMFALRYGTRVTLVLGSFLFSCATIWTVLGFGFASMLASRIAGGVGESLYNVSLLSFLGRSTVKYRALAVGFPASLFGFGVFLSPYLIGGMKTATGSWEFPFYALAACGLVGSAAIWVLLGGERARAEVRAPITWKLMRQVLVPENVALLLLNGVGGTVSYSFVSLYQSFLRVDQGFDLMNAAMIFSAFGFGQMIGGLPMGWVSDMVGRRRYLLCAIAVSALAGSTIYALPPSIPLEICVALVFGTASNSIWCVSIALMQDQVDHVAIPLATGILAMFNYGPSSFSGWLVAAVAGSLGWATAGILIYGLPLLVVLCVAAYLVRGLRPGVPRLTEMETHK